MFCAYTLFAVATWLKLFNEWRIEEHLTVKSGFFYRCITWHAVDDFRMLHVTYAMKLHWFIYISDKKLLFFSFDFHDCWIIWRIKKKMLRMLHKIKQHCINKDRIFVQLEMIMFWQILTITWALNNYLHSLNVACSYYCQRELGREAFHQSYEFDFIGLANVSYDVRSETYCLLFVCDKNIIGFHALTEQRESAKNQKNQKMFDIIRLEWYACNATLKIVMLIASHERQVRISLGKRVTS